MTGTPIIRRESELLSLTHDLRRDWHRWSAGERLTAVATMLLAVAIPAVVFLAATLI